MHSIRLRGPWQLEPVERYVRGADGAFERTSANLPAAAKATMPADWSGVCGSEFLGRVRYRRTFQKPTGLDSGERVWLVIEPPRSRGTVVLSDAPLGELIAGATGRWDITERLDDHNRLEIVVEHPALDGAMPAGDDDFQLTPGGLVGEVRLEIEE